MSIHRGACPTLETERLVLRPFRDDDVDDYFAVLDSPEVRRWLHLRAVQHGEVVVHVIVPERAQNKPFGLKRRAGHHVLSLPSDRQGDPRPLRGG